MPEIFYELRDLDNQGQGTSDDPTAYPSILVLWTPNGRQAFAIHRLDLTDAGVVAYGRDDLVITAFHRAMPFFLLPRNQCDPRTESELFERGLEEAQTEKLRKETAQRVLGKGDNDGTYR